MIIVGGDDVGLKPWGFEMMNVFSHNVIFNEQMFSCLMSWREMKKTNQVLEMEVIHIEVNKINTQMSCHLFLDFLDFFKISSVKNNINRAFKELMSSSGEKEMYSCASSA